MKILFDGHGLQARTHQATGTRLTALLNTITSVGWTADIGGPVDLDSIPLDDYDVVVLTGRNTQPYTVNELKALIQFVQNGKAVWCMANHAAFKPAGLANNHVRYESAVATTFYTDFQAAAYGPLVRGNSVILNGVSLTSHETIVGNSSWPLAPVAKSHLVRNVYTRSFCGVYPHHFSGTVANLDGATYACVNKQTSLPPLPTIAWAIALDGDPRVDVLELTDDVDEEFLETEEAWDAEAWGADEARRSPVGRGRMIICGDAGWLGNVESTIPGTGQFQHGDNPQYAVNTLAWLARL